MHLAEKEHAVQLRRHQGHRKPLPEPVPAHVLSRNDRAGVHNGNGLPNPLKIGLEHLSGFDFSGVRVHRDSPEPAKLNALAYTRGQNIHLGPGQERHLPHEGWHVVQQLQGRVPPTSQAGGVDINDNVSLEHEADIMGTRATRTKPDTGNATGKKPHAPHNTGVTQRRVVNPTEIQSTVGAADTNSAEIEGLRESLTDTLTGLYAANKTQIEKLFTPKATSVADIASRVSTMDRGTLDTLAGDLQKAFPDQEFNTSLFEIKAVGRHANSAAKTYWEKVKKVAMKWLLDARGDDTRVQQVFGDGTLDSKKSKDAAKRAKRKFRSAAKALDNAKHVTLDSSGISGNLDLGGYAVYPKTIFMVVDNISSPTKEEQLTAAHEGAHLASDRISDNLGYSSRIGEAFRLAGINKKLHNADHYAQVIEHREGIGTPLKLPFSPRVVGGGPVSDPRKTAWDTADTQALREEISNETRELWDATVDGFLESNEFRKEGKKMPNKRVANASKLMNMTLHRPMVNHTEITDLDLSLAESTVNRVSKLGDEVDSFADDTAKVTFDFLQSKVTTPFTAREKKKAAFNIILEKAKTSSKLKPVDISPTAEKHLGGLRNRKWRKSRPVF